MGIEKLLRFKRQTFEFIEKDKDNTFLIMLSIPIYNSYNEFVFNVKHKNKIRKFVTKLFIFAN